MRTSSTVDRLLEKVPNKVKNKNYLQPLCGLPLSPYFSAVKLKWLMDNVQRFVLSSIELHRHDNKFVFFVIFHCSVQQAVHNQTCLFGTVDTWLLWNLTGGVNNGVHCTDVTNASRTM